MILIFHVERYEMLLPCWVSLHERDSSKTTKIHEKYEEVRVEGSVQTERLLS